MNRQIQKAPQLLYYLAVGTSIGLVIGLFHFAVYSAGAATTALRNDAVYFFGLSFVGLILGFVEWVVAYNLHVGSPRVAKTREERLKRIRAKIRKRQAQSDAAQLRKPEFESRLTRYLKGVDESSKLPNHEPYVSKMPFWQAAGFGEGKVPKPIIVIRELLQRIHRLVSLPK